MDKTATSPTHTPAPWTVNRGGGHAPATICGSDYVHTNGLERNSAGISSASYSDEVCAIRHWMELPSVIANANLICAAPELLDAVRSFIIAFEETGGDMPMLGKFHEAFKSVADKAMGISDSLPSSK